MGSSRWNFGGAARVGLIDVVTTDACKGWHVLGTWRCDRSRGRLGRRDETVGLK